MDGMTASPIFAGIAAALLSAMLTFGVRAFALRFGYVAKPKTDRWHKRPTAMLGGIAIFLSVTAIYLVFAAPTPAAAAVLGGSAFLFLVGLIDDVVNIRPYQKLIGQLIGAGFLILAGLKLPLSGYEIVDIWLTVFWVVGITNAINLLDNMDGLAAGIATIAASSLAINFAANGLNNELILASALIGALLGFLVFNFNPASVFMGDSGSMFIGFLLSGSVLLNQAGGRSRGIVAVLAVPVLVLFVPIFDTTFVTVLRKLWGRKASQGGRDHTSHRLVALGLSERNAVLMLYAFAIGSGALALLVGHIEAFKSFALIGFFIVVLAILGVYLSRVKVYEGEDEQRAAEENAVFGFLVNVSHKRRIFEVFLDAFLITLAYYTSFAMLRMFEYESNWPLFLKTLPLLILVKLAALLVVGVYRGLWRYTSIGDLITITKGVILGSILSILVVLLVYRFEGFSRTVFFLDGVLLLLAIVGSRLAFRVIRQMLPAPLVDGGRRVIIYGAGDGGEMLLRELNNNPNWNSVAVGFIDDDGAKIDKVMHGLRVYDAGGSLSELCSANNVEEIIVAISDISPERLKRLRDECRGSRVTLRRAAIKIEPIDII